MYNHNGCKLCWFLLEKNSFERIINNKKSSLFFLQEAKVKREGRIKQGGYQIYELVRSLKLGGGLAIGAVD